MQNKIRPFGGYILFVLISVATVTMNTIALYGDSWKVDKNTKKGEGLWLICHGTCVDHFSDGYWQNACVAFLCMSVALNSLSLLTTFCNVLCDSMNNNSGVVLIMGSTVFSFVTVTIFVKNTLNDTSVEYGKSFYISITSLFCLAIDCIICVFC